MSDASLHGLRHWSISTVNKAEKDRGLLLLHIKGLRGSVGMAAYRGTASEAGVTAGLMDPSLPVADAQEIALKEFDRLTALNRGSTIDKERTAVPRIVENALNELRPYGVPSQAQYKIEWTHPKLRLPFLGFADFFWEDHGIIVDLKTTLRMEDDATDEHARQVASYCMGISDNLDGRVTYATPTKVATYRVEDMRERVETLVEITARLERWLMSVDSIDELCGDITPNYSLFYYDQQMKAAGKQLFGI